MSAASGGRTRRAGCGPRRLRRAEGRGSRTRASRRRLGSGRFPVAGGSALVWTALRGRAFLSGPHSPHRLACSRSQGAARRVRGAAGGAEERAGWGRGSERVRVPRTWSLGNVTAGNCQADVRQESCSSVGNCQADDRQESCSSAGNCQADEQTGIMQLSRP